MFEPGDYKKYGLTKKEAAFRILSSAIELINDVKRDDNILESDLDIVMEMIDESRTMLKEYIEEKDDIIIENINKAMKGYTDSVVGVVGSYEKSQKILRNTIELIKKGR